MAKKDELKNDEIKDDELIEEEDLDLEKDKVDIEDDDDIDEEDDDDIDEEDDDDIDEEDDDDIDEEDDVEDNENDKKADKKSKNEDKMYTEAEFNKKLEQIIAARTSQITKKVKKEKPKSKKTNVEKTSNEEVLEELRQLRQENKLNKFKTNAQSAGVDSNIIANILKVSDIDKLDDINLDELVSGSKKITNISTTKLTKKRVQGTKKLDKEADAALDELFGED